MTTTESPVTMTRLVRLTEIEADEDYWPRFALNQARVREFAALYREQAASMATGEEPGATLPPLLVTRWQNENGRYVLLDGWHRYHAAQEVGISGITVRFSAAPDEAAAFAEALAHTAFSALPLLPRERRMNVVTLINGGEDLTDSEIARRCGCHRKTVASIRGQLDAGEDEQVIIHGRAGGDRRTDEDGFTKATRGLVTAAIQLHEARRGFLGTRIGGKGTATTAKMTARLFRQQYGTEAATALGELASLLTEAKSHVDDAED